MSEEQKMKIVQDLWNKHKAIELLKEIKYLQSQPGYIECEVPESLKDPSFLFKKSPQKCGE